MRPGEKASGQRGTAGLIFKAAASLRPGQYAAPPVAIRKNGITVTGDRADVEELLGLLGGSGGSDAGAG